METIAGDWLACPQDFFTRSRSQGAPCGISFSLSWASSGYRPDKLKHVLQRRRQPEQLAAGQSGAMVASAVVVMLRPARPLQPLLSTIAAAAAAGRTASSGAARTGRGRKGRHLAPDIFGLANRALQVAIRVAVAAQHLEDAPALLAAVFINRHSRLSSYRMRAKARR